MNKLLKFTLIILLVLFSAQSQAQIKFGLKAGMNANNISKDLQSDADDEIFTSKMFYSYHFGATFEITLSNALLLQSGVMYTTKGWDVDFDEVFKEDIADGLTIDGYYRFMFNYIEVPLNLAYKFGDFQVYTGPYVAVMLSGKNKYDYTMKFDGDTESDSDEYIFKPVFGEVKDGDIPDDEEAIYGLDYGISLGAGYRLGNLLISAGYSLSLGNILPAYEGDPESRTDNRISPNAITLSLSYFFGF
jgi:hypothetical protein